MPELHVATQGTTPPLPPPPPPRSAFLRLLLSCPAHVLHVCPPNSSPQASVFAIYDDAKTLQYVGFSKGLRDSLRILFARRPEKAMYFKCVRLARLRLRRAALRCAALRCAALICHGVLPCVSHGGSAPALASAICRVKRLWPALLWRRWRCRLLSPPSLDLMPPAGLPTSPTWTSRQ